MRFPANTSGFRPRGPGRAFPVVAAVLLAIGCEAREPSSSVGGAVPPHSSTVDGKRTVSLSPAISATLADLGVGAAVVGRTPWCWAVPDEVPAVGSLLEIDYERLLAARPGVLLVQHGVAGLDPELERLARERGWAVGAWRLDRLADVDAMLVALGGMPPVAGDAEATRRLAARRAEIAAILAVRPAETAPRTLLLVSTDPPSAAAPGTYLDELLMAAGGRNALAGREGYIGLSLEEIAALAPDATVVLRDEPAGREVVLPAPLVDASGGRIAAVACREAFVPASVAPVAVEAIRSGLRSIDGGVR